MEAVDFVLVPTSFERATQSGRRSALITARDRLRTLPERGATEVISAESPPAWLVERIGPAPILSVEVSHWLFQAAVALCQVRSSHVPYLSTADFAQHTHGPESDESKANLAVLDLLPEAIFKSGPELAVALTADHGTVARTHGPYLEQILVAAGIAIILNEITGRPIGLTMMGLNVPLIALGFPYLGRLRSLVYTLYSARSTWSPTALWSWLPAWSLAGRQASMR